VVAAALVLVGLAAAGSASVADRLDPYAAEDPSTESARADALLRPPFASMAGSPAGRSSPWPSWCPPALSA